MARTATPDGILWQWDDNDNPGAGAKDVSKTGGSTGLNANWNEIEDFLLVAHKTSGALEDDIVEGTMLHTNVADASTIELNSNALRIVPNSITATQLKTTGSSEAVTTSTIRDSAVTTAKINALAVTTAKIDADAVTNAKLADDAVQSENISHDNTRTKQPYECIIDSTSSTYAKFMSVAFTSSLGIPAIQAGCITRVSACRSSGSVATNSGAYSNSGTRHFTQGQRLSAYYNSAVPQLEIRINDTVALTIEGTMTNPTIVSFEVEYDD